MALRSTTMTLRAVLILAFGIAWVGGEAQAATSGQQLAESAGRSLIGKPAPRLVVTTIDGETIDLGRLYGKQAVYLKFWATWCVPCREQMPHFERTYETAGTDLAVIAVNTGFNDPIGDVRDYRRKMGLTMPIVVDDGRFAAALHLRVTPQHIVIGRDGRIQYVGHLADARLDAALREARAAVGPAGRGENAVAAAAPGVVQSEPAQLAVGSQLPSRSAKTIDGRRFHFLDAHDPRHTVLVFLSPWCESYLETTRPAASANCRRMREEVTAVAGEGSARWLGVASGLWATPPDLKEYRLKYHVDIPLALDESGALFRAFNVKEVPVVLVADGSGRIVRRIEAADLATPSALKSAIGL
ncbi:MAG TPA: redoxin domain-containing protein [Steroidobacteraceae bacterium]|nr:redoxin domain-containing protein [Steroidobacteraceae bacterium]